MLSASVGGFLILRRYWSPSGKCIFFAEPHAVHVDKLLKKPRRAKSACILVLSFLRRDIGQGGLTSDRHVSVAACVRQEGGMPLTPSHGLHVPNPPPPNFDNFSTLNLHFLVAESYDHAAVHTDVLDQRSLVSTSSLARSWVSRQILQCAQNLGHQHYRFSSPRPNGEAFWVTESLNTPGEIVLYLSLSGAILPHEKGFAFGEYCLCVLSSLSNILIAGFVFVSKHGVDPRRLSSWK